MFFLLQAQRKQVALGITRQVEAFKAKDDEEIRAVKIRNSRDAIWTEYEFEQAANAIRRDRAKLSQRTVTGCREVLVNKKQVEEISNELGVLPGQISRAIRRFNDFRNK